jgi:hypothetical protein
MLISHRLVTIKVIKGDYIMDYKMSVKPLN